jgi:pimeloyl-ACP methyl ester carboxylesterase
MRVTAAPPVVLIHGACSQPAHLDAWREAFEAAGHDCTVPALPGHAPSDRRTLRRAGFDDYVAAMRLAVSDTARKPILVGHSMGALIARLLAAEGLARALVLLAPLPAGRVPVTAHALPFLPLVAPFVAAGLPFRPTRGAVRRLALHDLPRVEQDAIADGFVAESGRVYRQLALGHAHVGRRTVRCPVLVIHGSADRLVPVDAGAGIARKHGATFEIVDGAGHWLIARSRVPQVAHAALRWLDAAATAKRQLR